MAHPLGSTTQGTPELPRCGWGSVSAGMWCVTSKPHVPGGKPADSPDASALPGRARLGQRPLQSSAASPGVITQHPPELDVPGTRPPLPPLPSSSPQDVSNLNVFFHSLFRVEFQSNGWQLSPFLIISTPPKVMCKCGCCLLRVEVTCEGDYDTCLGSSAGKQHWP